MIINRDKKHTVVSVVAEETILEVLQKNGITGVQAPCGGKGTCGKCLVEVKGIGKVLACQTKASDDMEIVLPSDSDIAISKNGRCYRYETDGEADYAVACDLGTTTIVCHLIERKSGRVIDTLGGSNEQRSYGADVISRIQACNEGKLDRLQQAVVHQMNNYIEKLCQKNRISQEKIKYGAVVGNTIMCHILLGLSPETMGVAPFEPLSYFGQQYRAAEIGLMISGTIFVAPCVSGYVGGDITADLLAIQMKEQEDAILLLDIGTNGEMVLGNKEKSICCATAAGPAFEGAEIKMGMAAQEGAISKVFVRKVENEKLLGVETVNDGPSIGICGSGLIDALAVFLEEGIIDSTGCFFEKDEMNSIWKKHLREVEDETVFYLDETVYIAQSDIRKLQMAKAAVAAGVKTLMEQADLSTTDIKKMYLAGGFGNFLNPESAAVIGMIPKKLLPVTETIGNAAGEGAVSLAISAKAREQIKECRERCRYMELSTNQHFSEYYMEEMFFEEV